MGTKLNKFLIISGIGAVAAYFLLKKKTFLSREIYYDKVYGNWLGQIAGNFLGRPTEGSYRDLPNPAETIYYIPIGSLITGTCSPENYSICSVNSQTDDDTSMEWVDLDIFEKYGINPTYSNIRDEWMTYINTSIYFANQIARSLMDQGYYPPDTGSKELNQYWDYIDGQIECELFGVISPGMKDIAGNYADFFIRVTNDGYAVDFSKFYAMMYAEAFFENNISKIIDNVLKKFPETFASQIVKDVINWHKTYPNWRDTRQQIQNKYYIKHWIHADHNFASVIMSLLYSEGNFDKGIQIAALAGWDNDCNSPTTAGLLGIMVGASNIPDKWKVPIKNEYYNTNRGSLPNDALTNMAARSVSVGEKIILANKGKITEKGYYIKRN